MDAYRFVHKLGGKVIEPDLIICRDWAEWQSLPESSSPDFAVIRDGERILALSLGELPASRARRTNPVKNGGGA